MALIGTIEKTDGTFYVASSDPDYFKPALRTIRWKIIGAAPANGNYGPVPRLDENVGAEVTLRGGNFELYRNGAYLILLTEENGTVSHEPIPMPKVRAGIATRYDGGRWQKYSKREGWTRA